MSEIFYYYWHRESGDSGNCSCILPVLTCPSHHRSGEASKETAFPTPLASISVSRFLMTERESGTLGLKLKADADDSRVDNLVFGQRHLPDLSQPNRRRIDSRYLMRRNTYVMALCQRVEQRRRNRAQKVEFDGSCAIGCSIHDGTDK
ncbi:hypothetical protein [Ruegeria sp. HKCCD7318]|uniref:hypothetical protein n=1 Tax=Ruegeria sp. HKCCD7318 TaxID=2683014 RepID=UPI00149112D8|nr:hypothetical protein [Ruegeria sp. HKCCD7318]NOE33872.1 hypothetical protein [Ruegeria sp. HKCCD7318]